MNNFRSTYFRVACSLLLLGIDGGFISATVSYTFNEIFKLKKRRNTIECFCFLSFVFTSVSAANWVSCRSAKIFCAALTVSLSNAASVCCWSRKFVFVWIGKVEVEGLERERKDFYQWHTYQLKSYEINLITTNEQKGQIQIFLHVRLFVPWHPLWMCLRMKIVIKMWR